MGMTGPKRGNSRRSGRGHHRPDGTINVTPFVDVLLILLVVFMVVSTALPGLTRTASIVVVVFEPNRGRVYLTELIVSGLSMMPYSRAQKRKFLPL